MRLGCRVGCLSTMLLFLAGCASFRSARSNPDSFCFAPTADAGAAGTFWEVGGPSRDGVVPTPAAAGRAMAGTWDMLFAATEGIVPSYTSRSRMRFVATDSDMSVWCTFGKCRSPTTFPAAGSALRNGILFDSAQYARRASTDPVRLDVHFNRESGQLSMQPGQVVLDGGAPFYTITEISDSTYAGRWTSGSMVVTEVTRGGVATYEHLAGFFCAKRIGP